MEGQAIAGPARSKIKNGFCRVILGIGSDIIENARVEKLYKGHGKRFLERVFTQEEREYAFSHSDPIPYLAVRFAAKEAAIKALNLQRAAALSWKDIEIGGKTFGKKRLVFRNKAHSLAEKLKVKRRHISLSHSDALSIAVVILES